ncbi:MAG TPA: capsid cement protein [Methylomirabilota bacterium]|jgi:hypothetical protein|nr:capsid cement protein [Methylomirabilota bacterium]
MGEFAVLDTLTLIAAADLSASQYTLVRLSAARACNVASLATDSALVGVLQNKPKSGENATVGYLGKTKVVAGAAITVGAILSTDSSGHAITVVSGAVAFGRALEAAGAADQIITAIMYAPTRWAGAP